MDSEMLDFATENITTLHPDDSAEVVDSNGAEGDEMFWMTIKYKGLKKAEHLKPFFVFREFDYYVKPRWHWK